VVQERRCQPESMKGIYALEISVKKSVLVKVGKLGVLNFDKGLYVYVGSAQSSLGKRVERHLRRQKKRFWHIDYLLSSGHVKIAGVSLKSGAKSEECRFAVELARCSLPIVGFGCSDCKCVSHLYKVHDYQFLRRFMVEGGWCSFGRSEGR
jgi:Uri superfamily endonuclease